MTRQTAGRSSMPARSLVGIMKNAESCNNSSDNQPFLLTSSFTGKRIIQAEGQFAILAALMLELIRAASILGLAYFGITHPGLNQAMSEILGHW